MGLLLALQLVAFPLVVGSLLVATAVSAPLIPLLGLPIFIMGFPRPARQSPIAGSSYSANQDTVFYQQLMPRILEGLPSKLYSGFFGEAAEGSYYLMRFESRIIWMEILERGYGFSVVRNYSLEMT